MFPEPWGLLVTCEHGGNRIPRSLAHLFTGADEELTGHRGWDPGALALAQDLARWFDAPLLASTTSRLVVDLNRATRSRTLFSEFTRTLKDQERQALLDEHYTPHRDAAPKELEKVIRRGRTALHLSVHTFTPTLHGKERRVDVGLLYDPSRGPERDLCRRWLGSLRRAEPTLRVRRNYPYRGVADGHTTALRRLFPPGAYLGVEIEVNQRFPLAGGGPWSNLRQRICATLDETLRVQTKVSCEAAEP